MTWPDTRRNAGKEIDALERAINSARKARHESEQAPRVDAAADKRAHANLRELMPALRELARLCDVEPPKQPTPEDEALQETRRRMAQFARGGVFVGGEAA